MNEKIKETVHKLSKIIQEDEEYAWVWHCCIAMCAQDAGAKHKNANERTADLMKVMFNVDIRKTSYWKDFEKQWISESVIKDKIENNVIK